eukprot:gene18508-25009_t
MLLPFQLKTGPDSHMLLLSMHYAMSDGWSVALMMSEAVTSYNAFLFGSEPWLDPLPIQYSDDAMWHDTYLRESGEDIVLGTPLAGRSQSELQELIGFFVSSVVLRTDLSGNPDFRTLIGRVKDTALGAYANQSVHLNKTVEKLSGHVHPARLQSVERDGDGGVGTVEGRHDFWLGQTKFDVSAEMIEDLDGNIHGQLEFNADLWFLDSAERLAKQLRCSSSTGAAAVARSPHDICAHHQLKRFAAEPPSSPMLWFEGQALLHAQLDVVRYLHHRIALPGSGSDGGKQRLDLVCHDSRDRSAESGR